MSLLSCSNFCVNLIFVGAVMLSTIRRRRSWNTGTKDEMVFGSFVQKGVLKFILQYLELSSF